MCLKADFVCVISRHRYSLGDAIFRPPIDALPDRRRRPRPTAWPVVQSNPYVYAPDVEPYISNSGDLTREKIAKLVEMVIAN